MTGDALLKSQVGGGQTRRQAPAKAEGERKNAFRHAPSHIPFLVLSLCLASGSHTRCTDLGPLPLRLYQRDDKSMSLLSALSSNASLAHAHLQPHRGPPLPNLPLASHKLKREASQSHTTALRVHFCVHEQRTLNGTRSRLAHSRRRWRKSYGIEKGRTAGGRSLVGMKAGGGSRRTRSTRRELRR